MHYLNKSNISCCDNCGDRSPCSRPLIPPESRHTGPFTPHSHVPFGTSKMLPGLTYVGWVSILIFDLYAFVSFVLRVSV